MDEIISNNCFKKEADNYFKNKESYKSKIIDSLIKKDYSKKELSDYFSSKPTYYSSVKNLGKNKIIIFQDDYLKINPEFFRALSYYSLYYKMLERTRQNFTNLKESVLKDKMKKACLELEDILSFKKG